MGWALHGKPVTHLVTRKLAKEFATMDAVPHERPLSQKRLQVYKTLMVQGLFRPVTWAKAYCKETNGTYRVNGQHTSTLLTLLDVLPEFYVTVESYACDTLNDVGRLYNTFDSKMQSRSVSDINLSFASTIPTLSSSSARAINLTVSGIWYFNYSADAHLYERSTPAERAECLLDNQEFVVWLNDLICGNRVCSSNHLCRQPVVAVMYGSYKKSVEQATEFWTEVRNETGASPEVATRKIARWLMTHSVGRGNRSAKTNVSSKECFVRTIRAWNAWRQKVATDLRYSAGGKIPDMV